MRTLVLLSTLVFSFSLLSMNSYTYAQDGNKFVGVKSCVMCHTSEKQGKQQKIWLASRHANAYKTLQTTEANEIAKVAGLATEAVESEECLVCHATAYNVSAKLIDKKFKVEDGVQCETCHGAGSNYKKMKTMKDHAASVAAGMREFKSEKDIKAFCVTCHNDKSPTYKEFDFAVQWPKIKHTIPEK
ncbi:cytochrome c family protein [Bacteroidota bacterium]